MESHRLESIHQSGAGPVFPRGAWITLVALIAAFIALCAWQWPQPPIEDEILHHRCKVVWFEKGADWCELAHTPLYHEATTVWQKLFGVANADKPGSIAILRSFGTFTSLLTLGVFLWGLLGSGARSERRFWPSILAAALLVFHPYFVQYSLHLDYDSTVLVPPLLLAAILIERWDAAARPRSGLTILISIVFAIALFAKELTPVVLMALWPFWAILRRWRAEDRSWKLHFMHAVAGVALGCIFFVMILMVWGKWRGFNWYDPLLLTREKFFRRSGDVGGFFPWQQWGWLRFLFLTYIPILWIGFPFLYAASKVWGPSKFSFARVPFSIWSALGIFGAYTWLVQAGFYFPKYTQPAFPLLMFGVAGSASFLSKDFNCRTGVFALFFLALCLAGLLPWFDPLMIIEHRKNLNASTLFSHSISIAIPIALLWGFGKATKRGPQTAIWLGLLAYFLGVDIGHPLRPYQTRYLYGEHGFNETVQEIRKLKAMVSPNEPVISVARDIAWALGKDSRYLEMLNYEAGRHKWDAKVIVSRSYSESSIAENPAAKAEVQARFPCHRVIDLPGQRFEWWWKPPGGSRDACY